MTRYRPDEQSHVRRYYTLIAILFFLPQLVYAQFYDKVVWETFNWKVIHSPHFDIHYPEGNEYLAARAVEIAEEANLFLSGKFRHDLSEVIPVYLYPSHGYFQMSNIIPGVLDEGIGGLTEGARKRIMVPYQGSYDELRHVLTHEIVHAFQYDLLSGSRAGDFVGIPGGISAPLWLIEGMAEYYSIGWDSRTDMTIRDAVLTDTMPSIDAMTNFQILTPIILYKGGQTVLQFIAQTYGENKIVELLKDTRDQRDLKSAIKTNFGISIEDFNRNWSLWLKRLYYADVSRKSGTETGRQGTSHLYDKSILNLYPAISPDGETMAYISVRNFNPVIIIRKTKDISDAKNFSVRENEKSSEVVVVRAGQNEQFYQLHLLDNNISFSADSRKIFFTARSKGKDVLYLFDYGLKKIIKSWVPDVDMIQYPSLSPDGKFAIFTGSQKAKSDLFLINLETGKTQKLTDDYFSEKDPSFSCDGKDILFSSNYSLDLNIEKTDYDIFKLNLENGQSTKILELKGVQEKPQCIPGKPSELVFISDHEGLINAFSYDSESQKIIRLTDSFAGILSIKPGKVGSDYIVSVYKEQGYDVSLLKSENFVNTVSQESERIASFVLPEIPSRTPFLKDLRYDNYKPRFVLDNLLFGIEYSSYYGFGGFALFSISEYMGDHHLQGIIDFITNNGRFNFNMEYAFFRYRLKWHFGFFRATSYFSILNLLDLTSLNNLIYDPNLFTESLYRFGGYIRAEYPWTNFLRNTIGIEVSRYEETFRSIYDSGRLAIQTNIFAASAAMTFNNSLYSYTGPLKGTYFSISDRQTFNITGNDHIYNSLTADFRHYFNFFERYVLAIRTMAGAISGPQQDYYVWRMGGPFTMRGYDFLSIAGRYTFLANLELRFPFIDYFVFGFPVQWIIQGLSAVAFLDVGSAFNDFNSLVLFNDVTQSLQDLKVSFGLGLRFVLVPGILLRFDWATPWDLKSALPIEQWKFNFSLGYEY